MIRADVAIVGGGPAGACAAIRLADLGHHVVLIERAPFPRRHVGEALSPGVAVQLDFLGLRDHAGLVGMSFAASELDWNGGGWDRRPTHPAAMTVDRGGFDQALLAAAASRGATILQPARVQRCERDDIGWTLDIDRAAEATRIHARFLVDATGRTGFLPRQRKRRGTATFALHGYWRGRTPELPRVVAARDHWLWGSPVPGSGYSAIVFLDRRNLGRGTDPDVLYRRLAEHRLIDAGAELDGGVRLCDASSYIDTLIAGPDFLKIGEAAFVIDPLSSSGVQKAIGTALTSAIVINTVLRRPTDAAMALDFYRAEQERTVDRHAGWAADVYADCRLNIDDPFWQARASRATARPDPIPTPRIVRPDDRLSLSPDARLTDTPVLTADYVERQRAVVHPALDRPVAFIGGFPIVPMLCEPGARDEMEARLRTFMSAAAAKTAIEHLVSTGILVADGRGALAA